MRTSCKLLIIAFFGIAILFSCQSKEDSVTQNNNPNEAVVKTGDTHFNTQIAQVVNGQYQFVNDIDDIISDWEDLINNGSSLNVSFDTVYIEMISSEYYLSGIDYSEEAGSRVCLVLDSEVYYEKSYPGSTEESPQTGSTCTCTGCKTTGPLSVNDCQPKQNALDWYCTSCPHGFGECIKTVTATSGTGTLD